VADGGPEAPIPRKRSDARRNEETLLAAAAAAFVASGVDVPVRDIAARAGVGVGTMYRHFPTRADLVVAVYRHQVEKCAQAGPTLLNDSSSPLAALTDWIDLFIDGLTVPMVQWPSYIDLALASYRADRRLLAILEPLIGRDLKQIINQCHWKAPGAVAGDYNFHQDVRFRRPRAAFRDLATSYIQTGIAVDPHTHRNGAMRVLPGSHRQGEIASLGDGVVLGCGRGDKVLREAGLDTGGAGGRGTRTGRRGAVAPLHCARLGRE